MIHSRPCFTGWLSLLLLIVLFALIPLYGYCQRVLVVTTEQSLPQTALPQVCDVGNGEYVIADLTAAGYPFDVVTYGTFVTMDLVDHDVIVLNGHTTPVPVTTVSAKCSEAIRQGRKVFINGHWPFYRYDSSGNGTVAEYYNYIPLLFSASPNGWKKMFGCPVVPSCIEKDPDITAAGVSGVNCNIFKFSAPPALQVTLCGYPVAFLYPNGGAVDGAAEYTLCMLDYGKIVTYLRFGSEAGIGFANDRLSGKPIASFEVHCDITYDTVANNALDSLAHDTGVKLMNLLLYKKLTQNAAAEWQSLAAHPRMRIGSHSRTHPNDWPSVPDLKWETIDAITDTRTLVPATVNYLNFSGGMNPNTAQIDQMYGEWNMVFGATGGTGRLYPMPQGGYQIVQLLPTNRTWFINLSKSNSTPYLLSQTLNPDNAVWQKNHDYVADIRANFEKNLKFGMYTYGFFHDYMMNPANNFYTQGVHMSKQIRDAMAYLQSQGVEFMFTDDLVCRLGDFVQGSISTSPNPDGSLSATVFRPAGKVNDIKVRFRGDLTPVVTGEPVVSQTPVGEYMYVSLQPSTTSTVTANWLALPPSPPVVTSPATYISNNPTIRWTQPVHPGGIVEYQCAIGTYPGGTDWVPWQSAGPRTSVILSAWFKPGVRYYVAVRARYADGGWSTPGVSPVLTGEPTAPTEPVVTDDGEIQSSTTEMHCRWSSADPESGIVEYQYAVGTVPGGTDILDWTTTDQTQVTVSGLSLPMGITYCFSVRAKNGAGAWSATGVSDGISVGAVLGTLRDKPNGTPVDVGGLVVTAVVSGGFYAERSDRSSAIKVVSDELVEEGYVVSISGAMGEDGLERVISATGVNCTGQGTVRPLFITNRYLAGSSGVLLRGATDGVGLNTVGLLVRITGTIVDVGSDYITIDDGSGVTDGATSVGVKVFLAGPHSFQMSQHVIVTGICVLENCGDSACRRAVRVRTNSDVVAAAL